MVERSETHQSLREGSTGNEKGASKQAPFALLVGDIGGANVARDHSE
jgi:hypothetical protein